MRSDVMGIEREELYETVNSAEGRLLKDIVELEDKLELLSEEVVFLSNKVSKLER